MSEPADNGLTRRKFLRGAGRAAALTALGVSAGALATRRLSRDAHTCVSDSICRRCGVLAGCILPQAQSFRAATNGSPKS